MAWEGSLQMMADRPLLGMGWNRPVPMYDNYYKDSRIIEPQGLEMNDYFSIATALGIPALLSFAVYLGLTLKSGFSWEGGQRELIGRSEQSGIVPGRVDDLLRICCQAGAVTLLVGFCVDGGLFKLPTAWAFWTLFELGSLKTPDFQGNDTQPPNCPPV